MPNERLVLRRLAPTPSSNSIAFDITEGSLDFLIEASHTPGTVIGLAFWTTKWFFEVTWGPLVGPVITWPQGQYHGHFLISEIID